jgi:3-oxoacyl-[acyl-carrier-protein] synthase-3
MGDVTTLFAAIRAIRSYLPERVLTNEMLASEMNGWTPEQIFEKTGIRERHVAADAESASDLGVAAAMKLFEDGVCRPAEVDFVILCTQSPDYHLPTTACIVQDRLGLRRGVGSFDMNQGCSGFVYGLSAAKGLVETGQARNVLLITADTYSKYVGPRDRAVRAIFGDGAAATLVSAQDRDVAAIGPFVFGTDGRGKNHLIVRAGGSRMPRSQGTGEQREAEGGNWRSADNLFMNGPEIFNFTLRCVPETVKDLLSRAKLSMDDVDLFVFHQANGFMLERLRSKLCIPEDKFLVHMEHCANTVSSTIPIALEHAYLAGRIRPGTRAMLIGFGVGLSWAGTVARL